MPIHSLQKLLGYERITTTQIYARLYDNTLYRQFQEATARLESTASGEWARSITAAPSRPKNEVVAALSKNLG